MMIKQYREDVFRSFQKKAIAKKGGKFQTDLLEQAKEQPGKQFIEWLEDSMRKCSGVDGDITIGEEEPAIPNQPYTGGAFKSLPKNAAKEIWGTWRDVDQGILTSSPLWGYIVSRLIFEDKIKPYDLMVPESYKGGDPKPGKKAIELALRDKTNKKAMLMDACVRDFLRHLSGLQVVRGTRSVYQDCPVAKAWWQCHIAHDVAQNVRFDEDKIIDFLRRKVVWRNFTDKMASQLTVVGDRNIRDGLIWYFLDMERTGRKIDGTNMLAVIKSVGVVCAWRALGYFTPEEVRDIIKKDIAPAVAKAANGADGQKS